MHICVGLAAGIGNTIFALPTLQALRNAGHELTLWVDGDYPDLPALWQRCIYAHHVLDGAPPAQLPKADLYVCGHWRPRAMRNLPELRWYRYQSLDEPPYPEPEWSLFFQAARDLGCDGTDQQITGWCRDLVRDEHIDVGIVQGGKPGHIWARKRYEHMPTVATYLKQAGYSVAWLGTMQDEAPPPGVEDLRGRWSLAQMPDALASCRVVIGTDSGMTHLAASLGVPTVFVFTATNSVKGQPVGPRWEILQTDLLCQPCQATARWAVCRNWECQHVEPAEVVQTALEMMGYSGTIGQMLGHPRIER